MPQFELANFLPQLVWLTVFFAILYFGIVKLTLPRLGRVMNEREATVGGDIAAAEAAKGQADEIARAYEAAIAEARVNARGAVAAAKAEVSRAIEQRLAALSATLGEHNARADAELAQARARAMDEIGAVAAEAVAQIVERLTGARPAESDAGRAAATALADA